jgi:hypothetical protein
MYINLIRDMYESLKTNVKSLYGITKDFNIGIKSASGVSSKSLFVFCDNR